MRGGVQGAQGAQGGGGEAVGGVGFFGQGRGLVWGLGEVYVGESSPTINER